MLYNEQLKMLYDAPSTYERELNITQFVSKIPVSILKNGINSGRLGTDYIFETKQITNTSKLTAQMIGAGGFITIID